MAAPPGVVPSIPSGPRTHVAERGLERLARPLRDERAEGVVPRVRVDPARPGRGERRLALEREARRVGEQVSDGRSGRTGRLVEVEQAPVRGDQHRQRGASLVTDAQRKRWPALAAARDDPVGPDDRGRGVVGPQRVDRRPGRLRDRSWREA